jgi:hypothetical protein
MIILSFDAVQCELGTVLSVTKISDFRLPPVATDPNFISKSFIAGQILSTIECCTTVVYTIDITPLLALKLR